MSTIQTQTKICDRENMSLTCRRRRTFRGYGNGKQSCQPRDCAPNPYGQILRPTHSQVNEEGSKNMFVGRLWKRLQLSRKVSEKRSLMCGTQAAFPVSLR